MSARAGYLLMAVLGSCLWAGAAAAQAPRFLVSGGLDGVRLQSTTSTLSGELGGIALSGSARASYWKLEMDVRYAEGRLEASRGAPATRDLVDGQLMIGIRPVPWLSFRGGPHARGYLAGGVTERWLLWEARIRLDAFLAAPVVRGYAEVGGTLSGSIRNGTAPFGNSRLGEVGMLIRLPRTPVWLQFGYTVERTRFSSSVGLDAMETFRVALGVGN